MPDVTSHTPRFDALNDEQKRLMPNLFLIGGGKCGTTSLHAYLSHHPEITGAREKEPSFFCAKPDLERHQLMESMRPEANDLDAYLGLFEGGEATRYRLESSPTYSSYPEFPGVPERIKAASPQARIIFLMRDPVERAISHYWQDRKIMKERKPLLEAMQSDSLYVWGSDYKMQLDRYRPHFDDIILVTSNELRANPQKTLDTIFARLGLPAFEIDFEALGERNKTPPTTREPRFPLVRELRDTRAWNHLRRRMPSGLLKLSRKLTVRDVPRVAEGEAEVRQKLQARFAPMLASLDEEYGTALQDAWRQRAPAN